MKLDLNQLLLLSFNVDNSRVKMSASAQNSSAKNNIRVNLDRCTNFMRQFRDPESRELTKLSANQFMDVWSHYDKDGKHV